eukprot:365006-Chlamydomonas_euryale.AAC.3
MLRGQRMAAIAWQLMFAWCPLPGSQPMIAAAYLLVLAWRRVCGRCTAVHAWQSAALCICCMVAEARWQPPGLDVNLGAVWGPHRWQAQR